MAVSPRVVAATLAALAALAAPALSDTGIQVVMNQAKIVRLSQPADTVVIGNPSIADATVQDANTLVLTGRGFGVTNIVVLDREGNPIVDEQIYVSRSNPRSVQVYRRASVQMLSCTPYCESAYRGEAERTSEMEMGASH